MFGGLAFLCCGRMCCGLVGNDLMVRIPDDSFEAVMRSRHVRPMDFTGKPLKGFVYVSPSGFRTATALRAWLAYGEQVAEAKAATPTARRSRATTSGPGRPDSASSVCYGDGIAARRLGEPCRTERDRE